MAQIRNFGFNKPVQKPEIPGNSGRTERIRPHRRK